MEYAMPLVDDLLTDMEKYLWYYSLDAASGFWAMMMTQRARKISAYVCALGHFEWLRIPFGLKNAPMIYQRMIDNALWGIVQPRGGWSAFAERVRKAKAVDTAVGGSPTDTTIHNRTRFETDCDSSDTPDSLSAVVNDPRGGSLAAKPTNPRCPRLISCPTWCHGKGCELMRRSLKLSQSSRSRGRNKRVQAFLGALNYYNRFIQDFAIYGAALYQVREEDSGPGGDLSPAKRSFAALQAKVADAPILRHFDRAKEVHVMLFANDWALSTTLMQQYDGVMHPVRFCGRVLKDNEVNYHPAEKEVLVLLLLLKTCYTQLAGCSTNAYTRFSTLGWVNASKTLFGRSTQFAVMLSPWHLVVHRVNEDDSAFAQLLHSTITNFVGLDETLQRVAPPSKRTPMVQMDPALLYARLPNDHREYNTSTGSLAGETLAAKEAKTTLTEESKGKLEQLNRTHEVIYGESNREVTQVSTLRTLSGDMGTQRDIFFDFVLKPRFITAITRQQAQSAKKSAKKRVRFADIHDEESEALPVEPEPPDRPNDATTESSHVESGETFPGAAERPPSA
ncbi:unnamed protein product [Phytophthora fragariaefolia]|uniref:Unnamed protein product n=1 Tax=Phytophthora fragariaefolia TaxID=1490495 RepID=A0A9W6X179_9STRA|nr:unnamed protein product [Phytophthora fragariaefolia]